MGISTKAIEKAAANLGLSGRGIAREAGVSYVTVQKYRRGNVKNYNPVTLKKIADALHVKAETLLAE